MYWKLYAERGRERQACFPQGPTKGSSLRVGAPPASLRGNRLDGLLTLLITAASLSTSCRLSYFSHSFLKRLLVWLSRPLSFTSRDLVPVFCRNCTNDNRGPQT
jgi:hypothetical protein